MQFCVAHFWPVWCVGKVVVKVFIPRNSSQESRRDLSQNGIIILALLLTRLRLCVCGFSDQIIWSSVWFIVYGLSETHTFLSYMPYYGLRSKATVAPGQMLCPRTDLVCLGA